MKRLFWVLVVLVVPLPVVQAGVPQQFQDSINYVKSLQDESGGYKPYKATSAMRQPAPTLRATLSGVRAIKYFGGQLTNKEKTQTFVASCFDAQAGGFADIPGGKVDVLLTSLGVMAVVDLGMDVNKYQEPAVKYLSENVKTFEDVRIAAAAFESLKAAAPRAKEWIEILEKEQNSDGSFGKGDGKAKMTGSAVAAILRLGGKVKNPDGALKAMREGQQNNGGYGKGETPVDAELGTCYRVMRSFHMLKAMPEDVEGLRSFVEKCRNEDGGYSEAPAQPSSVAATYNAAIIHYWLKEKK